MLRRWDDSQHFLAQSPHLICEETANYLILWCFRLYAEEVQTEEQKTHRDSAAMRLYEELGKLTNTLSLSDLHQSQSSISWGLGIRL